MCKEVKNDMKEKILVVVAHPDDEMLMCGGTMAKLIREGYETYVLILSGGIDSRNISGSEVEKEKLKRACLRANKLIGVKNVYFENLPDQRFDAVPILDITQKIEKYKTEINPKIVFTHSRHDLNLDHKITYESVLTAFRPQLNESVMEIYSGEVLSSTEWNSPIAFSPNVFFDITDTIDIKISAMEEYADELRSMPHPRSLACIEMNTELWGAKIGTFHAEAFECVRVIKR